MAAAMWFDPSMKTEVAEGFTATLASAILEGLTILVALAGTGILDFAAPYAFTLW